MKRLRTFISLRRTLPVIAVMLVAIALPGCESKPQRVDYAAPMTPEDEAFLKGVNRPATPTTLFAMARMMVSQGRIGEAEMVLRRVIQQDPGFVPAYLELAEISLRRQRIGDAAEILMAGIEIAPKEGRLLNNLGMCFLMRGEYDLALEQFTRAAASMPQDARPRANMATALGMMGRYDESLALFQEVMPAAEAHYNLAILCRARDDMDRAEAEFAAAGELDPNLRQLADGTDNPAGAKAVPDGSSMR